MACPHRHCLFTQRSQRASFFRHYFLSRLLPRMAAIFSCHSSFITFQTSDNRNTHTQYVGHIILVLIFSTMGGRRRSKRPRRSASDASDRSTAAWTPTPAGPREGGRLRHGWKSFARSSDRSDPFLAKYKNKTAATFRFCHFVFVESALLFWEPQTSSFSYFFSFLFIRKGSGGFFDTLLFFFPRRFLLFAFCLNVACSFLLFFTDRLLAFECFETFALFYSFCLLWARRDIDIPSWQAFDNNTLSSSQFLMRWLL